MGTLGAGNHYAEIQIVDHVFDAAAARKMGIDRVGQARARALPRPRVRARVSTAEPALRLGRWPNLQRSAVPAAAGLAPVMGPCAQRAGQAGRLLGTRMLTACARRRGGRQVVIMIHSGSRGLGHQVATDALTTMERAMARDGIRVNDRQLACAHIGSQAGARGRASRSVLLHGWGAGAAEAYMAAPCLPSRLPRALDGSSGGAAQLRRRAVSAVSTARGVLGHAPTRRRRRRARTTWRRWRARPTTPGSTARP